MSLRDLNQDIRSGNYAPAYLLLGVEDLERRRAVDLFKKNVVPPESFSFNFAEFVLGKDSVREVVDAALTFPMMAPRRLVLVHDVQEIGETEREPLLAYLKSPQLRTVLVLVAPALDGRTSFYKLLRASVRFLEFPKLKGHALERWAEECVREQGYRMSGSALKKLVELAGADLQSLQHEIDKLLLFAGQDKTVPDSAVDMLVQSSRQHTVFELTDAVGRRDRIKALRLLGNLMDAGESPILIVALMARFYRQILIAQELLRSGKNQSEIVAATQVPSFAIEDFLRQARALDSLKVEETFLQLAEADRALKSSGVNERLILEKLICAA